MRTNVVGLMICCREAVRRMSTRRGGAGGVVVNVSTQAVAPAAKAAQDAPPNSPGSPGAPFFAGRWNRTM